MLGTLDTKKSWLYLDFHNIYHIELDGTSKLNDKQIERLILADTFSVILKLMFPVK